MPNGLRVLRGDGGETAILFIFLRRSDVKLHFYVGGAKKTYFHLFFSARCVTNRCWRGVVLVGGRRRRRHLSGFGGKQ